jgi:hypothetical protein
MDIPYIENDRSFIKNIKTNEDIYKHSARKSSVTIDIDKLNVNNLETRTFVNKNNAKITLKRSKSIINLGF